MPQQLSVPSLPGTAGFLPSELWVSLPLGREHSTSFLKRQNLRTEEGGATWEAGLIAGPLEWEAPDQLAAEIINIKPFSRKIHYLQLLGKTVLINSHFSQQCLK